MDLQILKKKIDGFRAPNGQLQNVPPELLLELRQAWENSSLPAGEFRRELGMKIGTLRKLLVDSKKLNHVLASSSAVGLADPDSDQAQAVNQVGGAGDDRLELFYDHGCKIIRFPTVDTLLEFLKKAS
jgi:hypothetical protein